MLDLGECKFSTLAKCWTPPSFASFQNPLYEAQAYHTLQRRFERFCGSAKQSINGAPPCAERDVFFFLPAPPTLTHAIYQRLIRGICNIEA